MSDGFDGKPIALRDPVSPGELRHWDECPCREGVLRTSGSQDTVRCVACQRFLYNAPRTQTGRAERTVTTVHNGIKPKQRARVLMRATGRCELCGASADLHVGHMVSVEAGLASGMTELDLNDDENLASMCAECNLGIGKEPIPLRLAVALVMARLRHQRKATG